MQFIAGVKRHNKGFILALEYGTYMTVIDDIAQFDPRTLASERLGTILQSSRQIRWRNIKRKERLFVVLTSKIYLRSFLTLSNRAVLVDE